MPDVGIMFHLLKSLGRFRRKHFQIFHRFVSVSSIFNTRDESISHSWRIVFYGTDKLSETTLNALNLDRMSTNDSKVVQSLEIVCKKSDCDVRRYATMNNLTTHTWPFDVPPDAYDVGIVVSFGEMIPTSSILACKYGIINAHPSLLPRWRGAAPIFHTILNGDVESGVTITQVSPNKFDVGNILIQEHYLVSEQCTAKKLMKDLGKLAADMIMKTLTKLPEYIKSCYPQPTEGIKLARKIKPQKCCINWTEDSPLNIDRKFRAFNDFFDLYTTWKGLKITVLGLASMQEVEESNISSLVQDSVAPGFCYFHKKRKIVFIKCKDGWSGIKLLKIPKRGQITALDFYNGFISKEDPDKCYFS